MAEIYLRIFRSPGADVSNNRIGLDVLAAQKIWSPIQVNSSEVRVLPFSVNINDINNNPGGEVETRLLDYNPDGLARSPQAISIYYLEGELNYAFAQSITRTRDEGANWEMFGNVFMPNGAAFNNDYSRFLLAHEIGHNLFARIVLRDGFITVDYQDPDPGRIGPTGDHSPDTNNLMYPTVPSSFDFATQSGNPVPPNILTAAQRQKAMESPYVQNPE